MLCYSRLGFLLLVFFFFPSHDFHSTAAFEDCFKVLFGKEKFRRVGSWRNTVNLSLISFCTKIQGWRSTLGMQRQEIISCFPQEGKGETLFLRSRGAHL